MVKCSSQWSVCVQNPSSSTWLTCLDSLFVSPPLSLAFDSHCLHSNSPWVSACSLFESSIRLQINFFLCQWSGAEWCSLIRPVNYDDSFRRFLWVGLLLVQIRPDFDLLLCLWSVRCLTFTYPLFFIQTLTVQITLTLAHCCLPLRFQQFMSNWSFMF